MDRQKSIWFWRLIFAGLFLALVWLANYWQPLHKLAVKSQPGLYQVSEVYDGDTITVDMLGQTETVRLIGVDTPETHHPNRPVQCFGAQAATYTKQLLLNQRVRLEADALNTDRDRYDRLLRYVYLDDQLVNELLIGQGYGLAYTHFPFSKVSHFVAREKLARQAQKGLWAACQIIIEPNSGRHTNPVN